MNYEHWIKNVPDFPKTGIIFKDIMPILATPEVFRAVIEDFAQEWSGKIDAIVALEARGFPFGGALAYELGLPLVVIRKQGKLPASCHQVSYDLEYGSATVEIQQGMITKNQRVLIVDDLLATGGTAMAAATLVERQEGIVVGFAFVAVLAELGGLKRLERYPIQSLVTYNEALI